MQKLILTLCVVLAFVALPALATTPYTASDLFNTKRVASAELSPDGKWIAYTIESQRAATDEPGTAYLEVYLVSPISKESRGLLTGKERATGLAWRPAGSAISFLAKREKQKETQVWMIPAAGGDAIQVTASPSPILSYKWSPDGKRLAYIAVNPPTAKEAKLKDAGYEFVYFEENLKHRNIYLVEIDGAGKAGAPVQLTNDINVWSFEFAPDGKTIAFGGSPQNLVDQEYVSQKVYLLDVASKTYRQLTNNPGKLGNYAFSPDGKHLAYNAALTKNDHSASQAMVIPVAGGEAKNLTPPNFRGHVAWVGWKDKNTLAYRAGEGVNTTLCSIPLNGKERTVMLNSAQGGIIVDNPSYTDGMKQMAFVGQSSAIPGEVFFWSGKALERLTNVNPWLNDRTLGKQEPIRYKARDGLEIEGLLISPVGYEQGKTYPLVVIVHGGPESHYSNGWLTRYAEPGQVLANKGYAVFYPNYRASTGYGVEFAAMGFGDAAGKEFDDVADGIDYLIAQGIADKQRVGLGGGSYGGFASAWFATYYTQKVRAVCMFVGISNLVSKVGTTDIPWEEYYVHAGRHIEEMWDFALKRSPIYYAHQSKTATLILGGQADPRVHPTQSMELYRRMKVNGHPAVRLVQYPGEQHGNARQPGRIDFLYRVLDWYDWYVKDLKPLNGPMPPLDISEKYGLDLTGKTEPGGTK